jgi:hypothetical protein
LMEALMTKLKKTGVLAVALAAPMVLSLDA